MRVYNHETQLDGGFLNYPWGPFNLVIISKGKTRTHREVNMIGVALFKPV